MGSIVFSLIFIFLILPSKYEFSVTIAVDLGADTYKIALTRPGNYMELVLNAESSRKTLNGVGFSAKERFVGDGAYNSGRKYPESTFRHPHFLLGSLYNSSLMKLYQSRFPTAQLMKHNISQHVMFDAKIFKEQFSPEALVSMILADAQMCTKALINSNVKNLAIVVRAFTDQVQRFYYKKAAEIANMKIVEIVDSNVAIGMRYLVSKMDKLSNEPQDVMIVDVGAYHTDATIYKCQELYENKNKKKPYPSCTIIGYGYTLKGVSEIDSIIMDIIIDKFERKTNVKYGTIANSRRNFTIMEEAKRIKKILTSVSQAKIAIESFYQDEDFYDTIKISEVEPRSNNFVESMLDAIDQSFKSANISSKDISQVVLMGGGSRVPLVQTIIKQKTNMDRLSNILNTDEDGVLGATFILASKSNFFKVKKIVVNKAAVFPIVVSYNKTEVHEKDGSTSEKIVEKTIYKHMQPTTQGKILTIKNVTHNLSINLKYGELPDYYDKTIIGSNQILCKYDLNGIEEAVEKYKGEYYLDKIRVYVSYDSFGIVSITSAEAVFHRIASTSTFDRLKEKVSNLFVGKKEDDDTGEPSELPDDLPDSYFVDELNSTTTSTSNMTDDHISPALVENDKFIDNNNTQTIHDNITTNYNETVSTTILDKIDNSTETAYEYNKDENITTTTAPTIAPTIAPKKLVKKFKHHLSILANKSSLLLPNDKELSHYKNKIGSIRKQEIQREQNAAAISKLESFINDCRYNLEDDGKWVGYVNDDEKSTLLLAVEKKGEWFDENGYSANATVNNQVRRDLNETFSNVYYRIHEQNYMKNLVELSLSITSRVNEFVMIIKNSTGSIKERFNMTSFGIFEDHLNMLKKMVSTDYDEWKKLKPWEKKPFSTTDVAKLVEKVQGESVEHITVFSNINKEIEKKMKDEARKNKKKEKASVDGKSNSKNSTETLNIDNSTIITEPENILNSTTISDVLLNNETTNYEQSNINAPNNVTHNEL